MARSKTTSRSRNKATNTGNSKARRRAHHRFDAPKAKTKQDCVLSLLQAPTGTTVSAIMNETGWQPHSVRGFLAGTVKKKLGLNLVSRKSGDVRTYRIVRTKPARAKASGAPAAGEADAVQS